MISKMISSFFKGSLTDNFKELKRAWVNIRSLVITSWLWSFTYLRFSFSHPQSGHAMAISPLLHLQGPKLLKPPLCIWLWSCNDQDVHPSSLKKLTVQLNNVREGGDKFYQLWDANESHCRYSCSRPHNYKESFHKGIFLPIPISPLHILVHIFRVPNSD